MTTVEDNPDAEKREEESGNNGLSFEKYLSEEAIFYPSESDKVYLDVIFGKTTEMTKEEFDGLYGKFLELEDLEVEEAESLTAANYDNIEYKEIKESAFNIDDLNGSQIDKESEFYKKYKTNIENFDYEDIDHPMNKYEFKIIKDKKNSKIDV